MMRPGGMLLMVMPCSPISRDRPFARLHRGLGRERGIQPFRLRLAGDVDDASPFARDHLRQQRMGDLPVAGEVQRDGFVPCAVGRIDRQRPAAAGIVDEDVDVAEFGDRGRRQLARGIFLHDVLRHRDHHAARRLDFLRQRIEQLARLATPTTRTPSSASPLAIARPIPMLAPLTTAVLDLRSRSMSALSVNNGHACQDGFGRPRPQV